MICCRVQTVVNCPDPSAWDPHGLVLQPFRLGRGDAERGIEEHTPTVEGVECGLCHQATHDARERASRCEHVWDAEASRSAMHEHILNCPVHVEMHQVELRHPFAQEPSYPSGEKELAPPREAVAEVREPVDV